MALGAVCLSATCCAQVASYTILPDLTSLPAGSNGASLRASVENLPPDSSFNVCFYTGFGSSVPIVPSLLTQKSNSASIVFQVDPSSIQKVPPASFNAGTFAAALYTVDSSVTTCTGPTQAQGSAATISLRYPTLASLSISTMPHLNTMYTGLLPTKLALTGANFLGGSATSSVLFTSTNVLAGSVSFISSTTLVTTIPATVPQNAASVDVQVCNTATYSYCSAAKKLRLTTQSTIIQAATASPNTASPLQPITVSATFGTIAPSVAGAVGGIVDFQYSGTKLGEAPLVLDKTGVLVPAATANFKAGHALGSPIVADFNQDGIPDLLLLESDSDSLHLMLGTTPSGSFAGDRIICFQVHGSDLLILSAAVADFNHDGFPDIVLIGRQANSISETNSVYTLLNDGSGSFPKLTLAYASVYGSRILAGDFDQDGKQDALIAGALSDSTGFQTLLGDGAGGFIAGPISSGLNTAPDKSFGDYKAVACDFNNDSYPDVAILNGGSADGTQLLKAVAVFQNDGHGAFALKSTIPTDSTASSTLLVAPLHIGQLPAILLVSPSNATISAVLNQSTTSIAFSGTPVSTSVPLLKQAVAGDFNGDTLLDVFVDDGSSIHVLNGNGNGSFSSDYPAMSISSISGMTLLAASDENVDTYADLLALTASSPASSGTINFTLRDFITAGSATATLPAQTFSVGPHAINASTPGTFNIECGSVTTSLTVTKIIPTVTWTAPAPIVAGTALSATQLDAMVTGPDGSPMPGTWTYQPAAGAVLAAGTQTLTAAFTPADSTNYAAVTASVSLQVVALQLTSLSNATAALGDAAKTITLTGNGFLPTAVVQMDGSPVVTTYINETTINAIIPASDFLTVHSIQVAVHDVALKVTTGSLAVSVTAPTAVVDFSGPTSITPGSQLILNFKLITAYPVDLYATFTVGFSPATGLPDDPDVQFSGGGRKLLIKIPAGTTSLQPVEVQAGTVAGSLTITTMLEAGGADVTPASVKPLTISSGFAAPEIISANFTRNGSMLTVTVRGFSNTREMTGAKFHFNPASGHTLETQDIAIDANLLYASWYSSEASLQYGSTCTYTQVFNLSTDASAVGQVSVILTNTQGASPEVNTQ